MRRISVYTVVATVVILILAVVPLGKRVYGGYVRSTVDYQTLYRLDCHHMARSCKNVAAITMIKKFGRHFERLVLASTILRELKSKLLQDSNSNLGNPLEV